MRLSKIRTFWISGHLNVEARLGNDFLDLAELENDRELPLIDRKNRHGEQRQQAEGE
jgi:hypothetical protein